MLSPEHNLLLQRRELFNDSVLRTVDEMRNSSSINSSSVDANNRPKNGVYNIYVKEGFLSSAYTYPFTLMCAHTMSLYMHTHSHTHTHTHIHTHTAHIITGITLDPNATHPLTGTQIPVYAADYIIGEYGTKAVIKYKCK